MQQSAVRASNHELALETNNYNRFEKEPFFGLLKLLITTFIRITTVFFSPLTYRGFLVDHVIPVHILPIRVIKFMK